MQASETFGFLKSEIIRTIQSSENPKFKKMKELLILRMDEKYINALIAYLKEKNEDVSNVVHALKLLEAKNDNLKEKLQSLNEKPFYFTMLENGSFRCSICQKNYRQGLSGHMIWLIHYSQLTIEELYYL